MSRDPTDIPTDEDIARQEDALDALLRQPTEPTLDGWPEPPTEPIPINHAAERQAFADLLALLSADDDGDGETEIVALSLNDFDAESIPASETDHARSMPDEEYQS